MDSRAQAIRHLFFDLDGTLIDHFGAIHQAYRSAQERLGLPEASYEKVKATVGGSVPVTMRRLAPEASEEVIEEALGIFQERFVEVMFDDVRILPGVEDFLRTCRESKGYRCHVFTNKHGPHARAVLDHLGLLGYFEVVAGAGDTPFRKPQREFSAWVLDRAGATAEASVLVGDSPFDLEAARAVGMEPVAVATGSHSAEDLVRAGAPRVARDFRELADWFFPEVRPVAG